MLLSLIPELSLWNPASATDAAVANPNSIKHLLGNGLSTLFTNGKPIFGKGPRTLPRNPPYCTTLDFFWLYDNFMLKHKLFAKALQRPVTWLLLSNNSCGQSYSSFILCCLFQFISL